MELSEEVVYTSCYAVILLDLTLKSCCLCAALISKVRYLKKKSHSSSWIAMLIRCVSYTFLIDFKNLSLCIYDSTSESRFYCIHIYFVFSKLHLTDLCLIL